MSRPRLVTLIVEVTRACDHACRHCYNHWRAPSPPEETAPAEGRDLVALLAHVLDQADCGHVTLSGGEPLLRDDIEDVARFLSARGVSLTLITNGRGLPGGRAAALAEAGVGLFEIPLLSHRREVHDDLSGRAGAFDAVLEGMADLMLCRGRVVSVFVATRRNIADFAPTLRLAFSFGAGGAMLNRFNPGGRGLDGWEELLPSPAQLRQALAEAQAFSRETGLPVSCGVPVQPCLVDTADFPDVGFGFCGAGGERAYFTLDAAGNLRPCNHSPQVLGNVWERPLAELVRSPAVASFRAARPASCAGCPREDSCQGGCKAAAQVCFGSLEAEEPWLQAWRGQRRPPPPPPAEAAP